MNTLNERATLKALNKKFPELTLDQLFLILDSLVFNYEYNIDWFKYKPSLIYGETTGNANIIMNNYKNNTNITGTFKTKNQLEEELVKEISKAL